MIERYSRPDLAAIWSPENVFRSWLRVELAVCDGWVAEGVVPPEDMAIIRERAAFSIEAVEERERQTAHDMAAFVDVVAARVGEAGRWIHLGLTSSDVLDTALALRVAQAGDLIVEGFERFAAVLTERAFEFESTLTVGRTHGVHAEPTSFGLKLAGFAAEAERNRIRLKRAFDAAAFGKLSGAVGSYSVISPEMEARVLGGLGLAVEPVATQVVPRDRHADLLSTIALAGAGLERFADEVRHLQRTEVREVEEPFGSGQKGSSAMPHKRNPILSERLSGLSRVLRGYAQAGLENVSLLHERDISHSSVERIVLPDATMLLDFMAHEGVRIAQGMTVHPDRMLANLDLTYGALFSQRALTALVESGMNRDRAYRIVQTTAQKAWDKQSSFKELFTAEVVPNHLSREEVEAVFDYGAFLRHVPTSLGRLPKASEPK